MGKFGYYNVKGNYKKTKEKKQEKDQDERTKIWRI